MCVCACVFCQYVCLSVTTKSAAYLVFMSQTKFYYGVFNVFTIWLSLKTLRSRVLTSFAGHHCFPRSLVSFRQPNETAMASFQLEKYNYNMVDYRSNNTTGSSLIVVHWQRSFLVISACYKLLIRNRVQYAFLSLL